MAKKIFEMSQHMADLIAAGEVVERPASVVKELAENAIDAGAGALTIEIRDGGMTFIRIADDGCGIAPEDAEAAFLRHATSKLREEKDLQSIGTLGFRGEALAAISSVSRMELFTRERGAQTGLYLSLEGGRLTERREAGCPEGTSMIVRDLFFNTPARLKFMKKDSAEGASAAVTAARIALSRPDISVRFIREGREEFHSPGDGRPESCVYAVLGRDFSASLLPAASSDEELSAKGFVSSPGAARGSRSHQFFFVNGRFVRSASLQAALEQAYRNRLFTGRFPACVLWLAVPPRALDVNVHPAKTEIKFLNERRVFDLVYYGAKGALDGESRPEVSYAPQRHDAPALSLRDSARDYLSAPGVSPAVSPPPAPPALPPERAQPEGEAEPAAPLLPARAPRAASPYIPGIAPEPAAPSAPPSAAPPSEGQQIELPLPPAAGWRVVGEALQKYIVAERGACLVLIDKHAAHERIIFDRLKAGDSPAAPQVLLAPYIAAVGREERALLLANREQIEALGFAFEDYSSDSIAVTEAPEGTELADIAPLLAELCEDIRLSRRGGGLPLRDELLASVACRAAVKAGSGSRPGELEPLAEAVLSGRVKYCPHGRPVLLELTERSLDRSFKRI